jgi:signal transduction histidine kinase
VVRVLVSQNTSQIKISIRDFGHGMSDEISERIFEPFMSTKQPGEGTGLGMALTYGIIRDHNGNIEVDSFPGAGTEVRIYLPLP